VVKKAAPKSVLKKKAVPKAAQPRRSAHSSIVIFYATDRKQVDLTNSKIKFGPERQLNGTLTYGTCTISIPKKHKVGRVECPSLLRLEFRPNPDKHVIILETLTLEEQDFLARVATSVAASEAKDAFIFVHGYNVTFEDAACRTAQIAFDLHFIGAPICYSWPASGRITNYAADEASIIWTSPHFERFLCLIADRTGAKRIHVIAHSMGNRAACDALRALSLKKADANVLLHHLVLAAPDIDADTFRQLAAALKSMSGHITLYASSRDKAIKLSQKLHKNARAGAPPLVIVPDVESIDASEMGADWLSHSYFSDNWPLLSDIHALLASDTPAAKRFGLTQISDARGTYYIFRASN
jgi:esterase/lipase superfamily enzyme